MLTVSLQTQQPTLVCFISIGQPPSVTCCCTQLHAPLVWRGVEEQAVVVVPHTLQRIPDLGAGCTRLLGAPRGLCAHIH